LAQGDPDHRPNPSVGPLVKPPFYAIKVFAGVVGTFAGIKANSSSQALDEAGDVIEGLYVAGNDMSSVTGGDYIGGGCTIGPALTFGYIAARHAAGLTEARNAKNISESESRSKAVV
jgi:succinate dehydrogenase/fumarate reductase flavoprotein subunit